MNHITTVQLAEHNKPDDCWVAIDDTVYNVTQYLKVHPGGYDQLFQFAGTDCTKTFVTVHTMGQRKVEQALKKMKIGAYVSDGSVSCPFTMMAKAGEIMIAEEKKRRSEAKERESSAERNIAMMTGGGTGSLLPTLETIGGARRKSAAAQGRRSSTFHRDSLQVGKNLRASVKKSRASAIPASTHREYLDATLEFLRSNKYLENFSFFFYQYSFRHSVDLHGLFKNASGKLATKFGKLFVQLVSTASLDEQGLTIFLSELSVL